ncbi:MAG: hypothetical protein ABI599_10995 [Flavobacteriales bacterium]
MRRTLLWVLLAGIVGGTAWTFMDWLKPSAKTADPWSAIPTECAVVLELSGSTSAWNNFTGAGQLWGTVSDRKGAVALDSLVARVLRSGADAKTMASPLFAVLRRGESSGWLAVIAGPGDDRSALWPQLLGILSGNPGDAAGRTFNPEEVFPATPSPGLPAVMLLWTKGLLLIGSDAGMIEEAQLQLKSGRSVFSDSTFAQAQGTLGDGADAHLLVQPARLARLLGVRLQRATADALTWPEGWAALDIRSKPDALLLSGLLKPASNNGVLKAISGQTVGHNAVLRVLPANTQLLQLQHISDARRWLAEREVGAPADSLLAEALFHWVQGSLAFATTAAGDSAATDYVVLQAGDPGAAEKALLGLCGEAACDSSTYRAVRLNALPVLDPFGGSLGPPFDAITAPHWCLLGDKVVMAKERVALERAIDAWTDGTALAADIRASAFFENIATESALTYWCNVGAASTWVEKHMTPAGAAQWHGYASAVSELGGFALQVSPGQHGFFNLDVRLQHGGASSNGATTEVSDNALWSITLRAPLARDPYLVLDHTTGTRYVLAQDTDNGLTAVSSTGKVMWSHELDGPILGTLQQVDRFKNGKLQLLFNTAQRVYMIDRNGKDVEGWPVLVKEKCSGPLAVLDYEGTKDYRILVTTEEAGILNLMPDGKPVNGWAAARMQAASGGPVRHLRVKNNDFLLAIDTDGNVYLLDRKGAPRLAARLKLPPRATVLDVRMGITIGSCAIVWTDENGAVQSGTIDGVVKELGPAAPGTATIADVDGDGAPEVIRSSADRLSITSSATQSWTRSLGCALAGAARSVSLGKTRNAVAVACADGERLWIMDPSGKPLPEMPLSGGKYFAIGDINKDGNPEIVLGSSSGTLRAIALPAAAE